MRHAYELTVQDNRYGQETVVSKWNGNESVRSLQAACFDLWIEDVVLVRAYMDGDHVMTVGDTDEVMAQRHKGWATLG